MDDDFPVPSGEVASMLCDFFEAKGDTQTSNLFRVGTVDIRVRDYGYNNYVLYSFALQIPVGLLAGIEAIRDDVVRKIHSACHTCVAGYCSNGRIDEVQLSAARDALGAGQLAHLANDDVEELWAGAPTRVFISHSSAQKSIAAALSEALAWFGIRGFVAHVHAKISSPWAKKIVTGLQTMDAMVTLVSAEFVAREYPNQEVGWALGRGIQVVPFSVDGVNADALHGTIQAHPLGVHLRHTARTVVETLCENPLRHEALAESLSNGLYSSNDLYVSQDIGELIRRIPPQSIPMTAKQKLWDACEKNSSVYGTGRFKNPHVPNDLIYPHIGRSLFKESFEGDLPF